MSFVDTSLIALRESLEAFLILGILAGLVVKVGHPEARKYLWWGAGLALGLSILAGIIINASVRDLFETSGSAELFEAIASLVAVGILTYMIVWMYRHTLGLLEQLRTKAKTALDAGRPAILFSLAFVAVAREGLETVLFFAAAAPTTSGLELAAAAVAGIAVSTVVALLVFAGVIRLNVQKFFAVTGVLLIFFAAGLLMTSIHEFHEAGEAAGVTYVPETPKAWNTEWLLDQHSTAGSLVKAIFGYRESPAILEATAYFAYLFGFAIWYLRGIIVASRFRDATGAEVKA